MSHLHFEEFELLQVAREAGYDESLGGGILLHGVGEAAQYQALKMTKDNS